MGALKNEVVSKMVTEVEAYSMLSKQGINPEQDCRMSIRDLMQLMAECDFTIEQMEAVACYVNDFYGM
jgi:hypothetical protein